MNKWWGGSAGGCSQSETQEDYPGNRAPVVNVPINPKGSFIQQEMSRSVCGRREHGREGAQD